MRPVKSPKRPRLLEASRVAACAKWFGEPEPTWTPRCDVYLYATAEDYSLATNQPPQVAGHSTIDSDGDRVTSRRIDVHCDDPNMFVGVLPHETTHVVLAGASASTVCRTGWTRAWRCCRSREAASTCT